MENFAVIDKKVFSVFMNSVYKTEISLIGFSNNNKDAQFFKFECEWVELSRNCFSSYNSIPQWYKDIPQWSFQTLYVPSLLSKAGDKLFKS